MPRNLQLSQHQALYTLRVLIPLFALTLLMHGCEQTQVATPVPVTITIAGSSGMFPVLQALTSEFSRQHSAVTFDLRGGGSTVGEELVASGQVDLAASTRQPVTAPQVFDPTSDSASLLHIPIGVDGIAIIVHQGNAITDVSRTQLQQLYAGEIVSWEEVGGDGGEVLLVSREDGSGSRQLFETHLMDDKPTSLTAVVMPTSADVVDFVSKSPDAIGYVSRAYIHNLLEEDKEGNPLPVHVVKLEGKLPLVNLLRDSSYLLSGPIFLVSNGEPQAWTRQFVEFTLSPAGQEIIGRYHAPIR